MADIEADLRAMAELLRELGPLSIEFVDLYGLWACTQCHGEEFYRKLPKDIVHTTDCPVARAQAYVGKYVGWLSP